MSPGAGALAEHNHHTQRSKRANSSNLVFERNKFRATLEGGSNAAGTTSTTTTTTAAAAESATSTETELTVVSTSAGAMTHNEGSCSTERHYSASSVTESTWLGAMVSPLAPTMSHHWRDNSNLAPQWPVLKVSQEQLCGLMDWHYRHPLPECEHVFPWLHGVHSENHTQREFLSSLKEFTSVERNQFDSLTHQRIPAISRGLIPVRSTLLPSELYKKSGVLKGSVDPQEILCPLDVSKDDLLTLLRNLLAELKISDDDVLNTLFEDCGVMGLLPLFRNLDPQRGISLRNFHIQVSKMAQISDLAVYCFNDHLKGEDSSCCCEPVSRLLYFAQLKHSIDHPELVDPMYQTLLVENCNLEFFRDSKHARFLAMDAIPTTALAHLKGRCFSDYDIDLFQSWESDYLMREKIEISKMSSATPIYGNVWLGNTINFECHKQKGYHPVHKSRDTSIPLYVDPENSTVRLNVTDFTDHDESVLLNPPGADWSLYVDCTDGAGFPPLTTVEYLIEEDDDTTNNLNMRFPPSGSLGIGDCNDNDIRTIVNVCKLLYTRSLKGHSSLIYCTDGYTESSLLATCFLIYATGLPLDEVAVELHKNLGRPFFLFPTDTQLLSRLQPILLHYSPQNKELEFNAHIAEDMSTDFIYKQLFLPRSMSWFVQISGSLPSRILPHLYLGSLTHANSFDLLQELDISYIVSVGESLVWLDNEPDIKREVINPNITVLSGFKNAPIKKLMCVSNVQDDGIDMLTHNLSDILELIDEAYHQRDKLLVHCRVGVSRSATVCIAEVMRRLNVNLIRAYIFVRVRRLNIIIQPNLRFMYELVKWEESVRLSKRCHRIPDYVLGSPEHSHKVQGHEMTKRLSNSVSSISSSFTDLSTCSPVRHIRCEMLHDAVVMDDEDVGNSLLDVKDEHYTDEDQWLRDVDWHILCREIDALNKAYIRF